MRMGLCPDGTGPTYQEACDSTKCVPNTVQIICHVYCYLWDQHKSKWQSLNIQSLQLRSLMSQFEDCGSLSSCMHCKSSLHIGGCGNCRWPRLGSKKAVLRPPAKKPLYSPAMHFTNLESPPMSPHLKSPSSQLEASSLKGDSIV
jgi:hypothetical protein